MKTKIVTLILTCCLFALTSFAQDREVAIDLPAPSISIASGTQSGMCFSLGYTDNYQPTYFFCGTGLSDKELREIKKQNRDQTPEFSIIDLQGSTVLKLVPEMLDCPQQNIEPTNDSGEPGNNNDQGSVIYPDVIGCGFGTLYNYTPMCGQVCVDQISLLPGYYVAILKTNAGTATKKFAVTTN